MRKRKRKLTRKQRRIKSRVTLRTLFLLSITLIFNTYAWFLYVNTVSANLTAHVDAWQVTFKVDDETIQREINFEIEHAYPGMDDEEKIVTVSNVGERPAELDYAIKSLRIFDDVFISTESVAEGAIVPEGATVISEAQLLSKIQNDYPFVLDIEKSSSALATSTSASLSMNFSWEYESGDDEEDTLYGTEAYEYYEENEGEPVIKVVIIITVQQQNI